MPKVRQQGVPWTVLKHLVDRVHDRELPEGQLLLLDQWLRTAPEVPYGRWFKRFPGMIACGDGELVTTFLRIGQVPFGEEVL